VFRLLAVAPCRAPLMLVALMLPNLVQAQDSESIAPGTIDTEHIFGFAEGADIGAQGDRELEITATGLAGKLGQYAGIQNETALRYGVADGFRASLGALADYHAVASVAGPRRSSFAECFRRSVERVQMAVPEPLQLTARPYAFV
jgi:hypothetical protein